MKSIVDRIFNKNIIGTMSSTVNEIYFYKKITSNEERAIKNYINLLEQQLEAKDKALDKACGKIAYDNNDNEYYISKFECPNTQYGFKCERCKRDIEECYGRSHECWKEWAENEKISSN